MGYFMRYFVTGAGDVKLPTIETALKAVDSSYSVVPDASVEDFGELRIAGDLLARIEINFPGDDIFDDDLDEFKDLVGPPKLDNEKRVLEMLNQTAALIALEVFWEGTNSEPVFEKIDPLWQWLFEQHSGILQADGEGFYDQTGLIVERNFTL